MILSPSNLQTRTILSSRDFRRLTLHAHLVTFSESLFQGLVGLPLNSYKSTDSQLPLPRIYIGLTPFAEIALDFKSFLNLAHASFICCQQFLLLDKKVNRHSPSTFLMLWSGSTGFNCMLVFQSKEYQTLPQIPHLHIPCLLNIPTS